jgi:hypothetical protein
MELSRGWVKICVRDRTASRDFYFHLWHKRSVGESKDLPVVKLWQNAVVRQTDCEYASAKDNTLTFDDGAGRSQ